MPVRSLEVMIALIIAAEIAFWSILFSGLAIRYVLGRARFGMALLVATPVVDLALLAATTIDLRRGGEAALPHALAAVYIGVSVAWGKRMVSWADARFAHRFAGGPPPARAPRTGRRHAAHQRSEWLRHLGAWATGTALLGLESWSSAISTGPWPLSTSASSGRWCSRSTF